MTSANEYRDQSIASLRRLEQLKEGL